jgi:hypothetical protein
MSNQQQAFLPVAWLGSYSFKTMPQNIAFDQETVVWPHQVVGRHEATEPLGYTAKKLSLTGFLQSYDSSSLNSMFKWVGDITSPPGSSDGYKNRPCTIGLFDQDSSSSSSSQLWYSGVGYLTTIHFEYPGGFAQYKYPYRFSWIEAYPLTRFSTTTPITLGTTTFSFSVTTACSGYLAAVELVGDGFGTPSNAIQSIIALRDSTSTLIGQGPALGIGSQQLFGGNPSIVYSSLPRPGLMWPLTDTAGHQSIKVTAPISAATYTVQFASSFSPLPSAINLVLVQT